MYVLLFQPELNLLMRILSSISPFRSNLNHSFDLLVRREKGPLIVLNCSPDILHPVCTYSEMDQFPEKTGMPCEDASRNLDKCTARNTSQLDHLLVLLHLVFLFCVRMSLNIIASLFLPHVFYTVSLTFHISPTLTPLLARNSIGTLKL